MLGEPQSRSELCCGRAGFLLPGESQARPKVPERLSLWTPASPRAQRAGALGIRADFIIR